MANAILVHTVDAHGMTLQVWRRGRFYAVQAFFTRDRNMPRAKAWNYAWTSVRAACESYGMPY